VCARARACVRARVRVCARGACARVRVCVCVSHKQNGLQPKMEKQITE